MPISTAIKTSVDCNDENTRMRRLWRKVSCILFGHKVSNIAFEAMYGSERHCACGVDYLGRREQTRVSHTVSCFIFGHRYIQIAVRTGHNEYVCVQCGHPLLFNIDRDPYSRQ